MRSAHVLSLALCFLLLCTAPGCGDDDEITGGDDAGSQSSSGALSRSGAQGDGDDAELTADELRFVVGSEKQVVKLTKLSTVSFKQQPMIALPELWSALQREDNLQDYTFWFLGSDGFRPEGRSRCQDVTIDGATFQRGYLSPQGRNLAWDDELGFSGCMFIKDLVQIEARKP